MLLERRDRSVSPEALSRLPSQFCVKKSLLKENNNNKKKIHISSLAVIGRKGKRGETVMEGITE